MMSTRREKQTAVSGNAENLTDYTNDLLQVNHFQHRLDTQSFQEMSEWTMELIPSNSFVYLSW